MSKRKREEESEDEFFISYVPPISRKQMYEEAEQEIRKCQEVIQATRHKLEQLSDEVEDFHCMDSVSCIDEANNQMEDALTSLQQSSRHWVSFLAIPEVPMRHILKYLSFEEKANFRLSSQIHRQIVDWFDIDFKTVKINTRMFGRSEITEMLQTFKDIKLNYSNHDQNLDEELLTEISDRLVEMRGPLKILNSLSLPSKLEKISLMGGITSLQESFHFNNFGSNLKSLNLYQINLSMLVDQSFSLPHLEKLELEVVTGFAGFVQLCASCSLSLKEISLSCWYSSENQNPASIQGIEMKRLKKMEIKKCEYFSGIFNLVKIVSNSLQTLILDDVNEGDTALEHQELSLPMLEKLCLIRCYPGHLSILTCSAPRLNSVALDDMELTNITLNPVSKITKLKITACNKLEGVKKLLATVAPDIEDLELWRYRADELDSINFSFPKLKRVYLRRCGPSSTFSILSRSPSIQDLSMYIRGYLVESFANELNAVLSNLSKDCLKELMIVQANSPRLGVEQLKLTKLSICDSKNPPVCDLLNACQSTLEELEIRDSFWGTEVLDLKGLQDLEVLKKLTIQFYGREAGYENMIRPDGLNELFGQCSKSLERLVLNLVVKEDFCRKKVDEHLLSLDLNFPNLKILHVYPRPPDNIVKQMKRKLPQDVTSWFFLPTRKLTPEAYRYEPLIF